MWRGLADDDDPAHVALVNQLADFREQILTADLDALPA